MLAVRDNPVELRRGIIALLACYAAGVAGAGLYQLAIGGGWSHFGMVILICVGMICALSAVHWLLTGVLRVVSITVMVAFVLVLGLFVWGLEALSGGRGFWLGFGIPFVLFVLWADHRRAAGTVRLKPLSMSRREAALLYGSITRP